MKITSKDLFAQVKKQHETTLAAAFKSGNPEQMAEAMTAFFDGMNEAVLQKAAEEIDARNQDAAILSARGANVLTADERAYYEGLAAALKASDPRAAVANYEVAMPQTVIERIIGTIKKTHPLLDKLNFVSTAYLSRILVNAKPAQLATWGKITGAVQKEIEGGVQEIALTMCKLSAFLCISMDLVELGPEWMDAYARETLSEAIACACEAGAVAGTGKDEPIGMIRDMAADVSPTTGYAKQTPVKVKKLDPATMGALLKKLARDPNDSTGKTARVVDPRDVIVVFNPFDYWEKVFAATTLLVGGQYVTNVLPIPAEIFQSSALEQGEAVIGIAPYYFIGVGPSGKQGTIIPDDSVKFLEDQRAYKAKLQGNGCPMDKYAFLLLDVSELEKKTIITKETVTFKTGLITWVPQYIQALIQTARIDETTKKGHRLFQLGGLSNLNKKRYLWRFVHTRDDGRKLRITVTGKNTGAISMAFQPENETTVDSEITADTLDKDGTLVILDDELVTTQSEADGG